MQYSGRVASSKLLTDVALGLAAGWVGSTVKSAAESSLQEWGERKLPPEPGQKELDGADPAGHGDRMPPSLLYRKLVAARKGQTAADALDDDELEAGAQWFHRALAYGYPVFYAVLTRRVPLARAGGGALGGAALFAAFHGSTLPALGVQASPSELPRAWWVWEGGSHVAYGVAVDFVVDVLRRVTR